MKAKNKQTGDIVEVIKTENKEFPYRLFGFAISTERFNKLYEIVEDNDLIFSNGFRLSGEMVLDGIVSPSTKLTVHTEDPNHPYGGMEYRLKTIFIDNEAIFSTGDEKRCIKDIKDLFQQELERIKNNFMTEFTDPDTNLINISKYDHEEIINFFNREIK